MRHSCRKAAMSRETKSALPALLSCIGALFVCAVLTNGGGQGGRSELLGEERIFVYPYMSLADKSSLANTHLMEEGSISVDANSKNPSADFYANAGDAGDDDNVEDAGPGGICKISTVCPDGE